MSSAKKQLLPVLILAAAALLIACGIRLSRGKRLLSDTLYFSQDDTQESEMQPEWETETIPATTEDYTTAVADESETLFPDSEIRDASVPVSEESSLATEAPAAFTDAASRRLAARFRLFLTAAGIFCILLGLGAALVVFLQLPARDPLAGPDGAAVLILLSWGLRLNVRGAVFGLAFLLFVHLIALREFIGWFSSRHPLSWLLTVRLAAGITQLAYGRDIRHFSEQLIRFENGEAVEAGRGLYGAQEEKLRTIQEEHAKAIRDAVTSERFKVELISNVSHDLRTPLTSILGYSELLQDEVHSEKGKEQLRQLNRKAEYMKDLVDAIFELTRISSGTSAPALEELDLVSLLEQTIGLFQEELDQAGLTIKRHYAADKMLVWTDGARMHQVFANLLENASKYALPGSRIYVYAEETPAHIRIRMVNTASYEMDFSPEEIVQRFVRGDKTRTTKGSGLGLAIATTYSASVGGSFEVQIDGDQFNAIVCLPRTVSAADGV